MDFIEDKIITRFGTPLKITTDNAKAFSSQEMNDFCFKYGIVLSHSSDYYPQGNGLAESSNKNLMTILKKTVGDNKRSWDGKIKYALWADRITKKNSTGKTPFELVYGITATLPLSMQIPIFRMLSDYEAEKDEMEQRVNQIIELDGSRRASLDQLLRHQESVKGTFDKSAKPRSFQIGDTVLLWDKRREKLGKNGKFDSLWRGPYIICDFVGTNFFILNTMEGERLNLPINGQQLKLFYSNDL